ncbi:MAG: hypothetical protein AAF939_18820, partial [Planctomycetota bacterium]
MSDGPPEMRYVFIGSEFIEQQIKHNFFEAYLTLASDQQFEYRNLGWAGDTPSCVARGYFNGAKEGFVRLKEELERLNPTHILVCYGGNAPPNEFEPDFEQLLGLLQSYPAKITCFSHPAAEHISNRAIDVNPMNQMRRANARIMNRMIADRSNDRLRFIDLYQLSKPILETSQLLTHDTIRFNEQGYKELSEIMVKELVEKTIDQILDPDDVDEKKLAEIRQRLKIKNELYFHRYRPQNETYLRGFRKHEQGQNAKEIVQFDQLIDRAES